MKTENLEFDTAGGSSTAFMAMPGKTDEKTKAIILIHEWWGLNDHIKDIANRYADEGFIAIAPDLYRGKVTKDAGEASELMHALEIEDGLNTIDNAMKAAEEKYGITQFGITGFCMGGTFALRAACELEGIGAAAPFYGDIPDESVLKNLKCPVIFISGTRDKWISPEKVGELERAAKENYLPIESVKYDADHAFFNSTRPEVYDEAAAQDAWGRVIAFFRENLNKPAPELNEIDTADLK